MTESMSLSILVNSIVEIGYFDEDSSFNQIKNDKNTLNCFGINTNLGLHSDLTWFCH